MGGRSPPSVPISKAQCAGFLPQLVPDPRVRGALDQRLGMCPLV
jgi:hypothetical protein